MRQSSFTIYEKEILPNGFRFPEKYIELSKGKGMPPKFLWWFTNADSEAGKLSWELRHQDGDNVIPFAREGDWAAFFDGNDLNGDPGIIVIDLGNTENTYRMENFAAWYQEALEDTEKYMR